ncbi:MAG: biotin/lipoyl-binding protein [Melioribacteraceae bacterium]|nr:biotin/lipoyl-binding protein [Melioribacteraceae bacterium]
MKKLLAITSIIALLIGCGDNGEKDKIELSGTVETTNIILSSQVAGTIQQIVREEGNRVNAGDTIMIIDPETYQLQLNQAEAQRDLTKSKYDMLKKGARSEDKSQASEALKQAEANYESAKV